MAGFTHQDAVNELRTTCRQHRNDISRVHALFESTKLLGAIDATRELSDNFHMKNDGMIRALLEHGADPNGLVMRRATKDLSLMRTLLERGADPSEMRISMISLDFLKVLAEFGYDIGSQGHLVFQDFADSREALDWLLDQGADITRSNPDRDANGRGYPTSTNGCPPKDDTSKVLSSVAARGDVELFDYLVTRGADPQHSLGLHFVCQCRNPEKMKAMIACLIEKHGLNIEANSRDLQDFPLWFVAEANAPLNAAVARENLDAVGELLRRGARPDGIPGHDKPIGLAIGDWGKDEGWLPAIRPLLRAGADKQDALRMAASKDKNNLDAAQIILEFGADPALVLELADMSTDHPDYDEDYTYELSSEMRKVLEDWMNRN